MYMQAAISPQGTLLTAHIRCFASEGAAPMGLVLGLIVCTVGHATCGLIQATLVGTLSLRGPSDPLNHFQVGLSLVKCSQRRL